MEHLTAAQGQALVDRYGDPLTALTGVTAVGVGGTDIDAVIQVFHDTDDLEALEEQVRGMLPDVPIELIGMSPMSGEWDHH